jgi:hypothetical protein
MIHFSIRLPSFCHLNFQFGLSQVKRMPLMEKLQLQFMDVYLLHSSF